MGKPRTVQSCPGLTAMPQDAVLLFNSTSAWQFVAACCSSGAAPAELLHPADPQAAAAAAAVARMCDTDLATAIVYERWVDDEVRCSRGHASIHQAHLFDTICSTCLPLVCHNRAGSGAGGRCWGPTACCGRWALWWRAWLARPALSVRRSRQGCWVAGICSACAQS